MAEHDRGPVVGPGFGDVHADAVGVDVPVTNHVSRITWLGPVEVGRRVVGEVGAAERGGVGQRQVHVGLLLEAERRAGAPAVEHVTTGATVVGQEVQVVAGHSPRLKRTVATRSRPWCR